MSVNLHGILVPIITPFTRNYDVDEPILKKHISFLLENGVHSIIPCGSTGEFPLLSFNERRKVVETTIDQVKSSVPVVPAVTSVSTDEAVSHAKHAKDAGAAAVLVAPSYYFKPTEKELAGYYRAVAKVGLPVILYNIPATVKVDMSPEFMIKLAEEDSNIKYVKEATGDVSRVHEIIRLGGDKLSVLCGHDSIALEMFVLGVKGWIPPAANFLPRECTQLYETAVVKGDFRRARDLYYKLLPTLVLLEGSGKFVQYSKAGVELIGRQAGPPRLPLLPSSEEETSALRRCISELQRDSSKLGSE